MATIGDIMEPLDNIFTLQTANMVFFMGVGFCFLEMGTIKERNLQHVLAKYMLAPLIGFLSWYVLGYGIAFGANFKSLEDGVAPGTWASGAKFVMGSFWDMKYLFKHWFFSGCFCNVVSFVFSAGVSERMHLLGFAIFILFLTAIIYPVGVYWAWSGYGWLRHTDAGGAEVSNVGPFFKDWAGSCVVHFVGGVAALVGALLVGPRKGRFDAGADAKNFAPHNVAFTVIGTLILWFCWYGYNTGNALHSTNVWVNKQQVQSYNVMHSSEVAYRSAIVTVNTTLAACTCGLIVFFFRSVVFPPRTLDLVSLTKGVLAGLVAITAGCGYVKHFEAICIGGIAAAFHLVSVWLLPKLKIDDPVDAISIHLVQGIWGTLAVGFFGNHKEGLGGEGVFYGDSQLGIQFLALLCYAVLVATPALVILVPLRLLGFLKWDGVAPTEAVEASEAAAAPAAPATKVADHVPEEKAAIQSESV